MSDDKVYRDGDIVWVKLGNNWWPAEVTAVHRQPDGLIKHLKRKPYCVVKFFQEDQYEYVKSAKLIFPFQCTKKDEFIRKGIALFNSKNKFMEKFPSDVEFAERLTGRSNDEIMNSSDSIVQAILGQRLIHRSSDYYGCNRSGASITKILNITPNRTNISSETARNCTSSSKDNDNSYTQSNAGAVKVAPPFSGSSISNIYYCGSCDFKSQRQHVMILHRKTHSSGANTTITTTINALKSTAPAILSSKVDSRISSTLKPWHVGSTNTTFTSKSSNHAKTNMPNEFKNVSFTSHTRTINSNTDLPSSPDSLSSPTNRDSDNAVTTKLTNKMTMLSSSSLSKRLLRSSPHIVADMSEITLPTVVLPKKPMKFNKKAAKKTAVENSNEAAQLPLNITEVSGIKIAAMKHNVNVAPIVVAPKRNSEEIRQSLLADWSDEEKDDEDDNECQQEVAVEASSLTISNSNLTNQKSKYVNYDGDSSIITVGKVSTSVVATSPTTSNRSIRNIPKKDRRDIVMKEFNNEFLTTSSNSSASTTPPIISIDCNSSDSVVAIDASVSYTPNNNNNITFETINVDDDENDNIETNDGGNEVEGEMLQPPSLQPPPIPIAIATIDVKSIECATNISLNSTEKSEESTVCIEADESRIETSTASIDADAPVITTSSPIVEATTITSSTSARADTSTSSTTSAQTVNANVSIISTYSLCAETPTITTSTVTISDDASVVATSTPMTLSCFDFQEDEDNDCHVLTSIATFKKKNYSSDKTQQTAAMSLHGSNDNSIKCTNDKAKYELEQKDQQLSAEIENLLQQTSATVINMSVAVATPTATSTTIIASSSCSNKDDASLPIKERSKRFFKSRHSSSKKSVSISTDNNGSQMPDNGKVNVNNCDDYQASVTMHKPIEQIHSNLYGSNEDGDDFLKPLLSEKKDEDEHEDQTESKSNDHVSTDNDELTKEEHETSYTDINVTSEINALICNKIINIEELKKNSFEMSRSSSPSSSNNVANIATYKNSKSEQTLQTVVDTNEQDETDNKTNIGESSAEEEDELMKVTKHLPTAVECRKESEKPVEVTEILASALSGGAEEKQNNDEIFVDIPAEIDDSVNGVKDSLLMGDPSDIIGGTSSELPSPTDDNSSVGISEADAEFGSPTSMLDDDRLPLLTSNLIANTECYLPITSTIDIEDDMSENAKVDNSSVKAACVGSENLEGVDDPGNNTVVKKSGEYQVGTVHNSSVADDEIPTKSYTAQAQPLLLQENDDDDDEIESPPHEALSGNEFEAEIEKVRKSVKTKKLTATKPSNTKRKGNGKIPLTAKRNIKINIINNEIVEDAKDDQNYEKTNTHRNKSKSLDNPKILSEMTDEYSVKRITRSSLQQQSRDSVEKQDEEDVALLSPEAQSPSSSNVRKWNRKTRNVIEEKQSEEINVTEDMLTRMEEDKVGGVHSTKVGLNEAIENVERNNINDDNDKLKEELANIIIEEVLEPDPLDTTQQKQDNESEQSLTPRKRRSHVKVTPRRRCSEIIVQKDDLKVTGNVEYDHYSPEKKKKKLNPEKHIKAVEREVKKNADTDTNSSSEKEKENSEQVKNNEMNISDDRNKREDQVLAIKIDILEYAIDIGRDKTDKEKIDEMKVDDMLEMDEKKTKDELINEKNTDVADSDIKLERENIKKTSIDQTKMDVFGVGNQNAEATKKVIQKETYICALNNTNANSLESDCTPTTQEDQVIMNDTVNNAAAVTEPGTSIISSASSSLPRSFVSHVGGGNNVSEIRSFRRQRPAESSASNLNPPHDTLSAKVDGNYRRASISKLIDTGAVADICAPFTSSPVCINVDVNNPLSTQMANIQMQMQMQQNKGSNSILKREASTDEEAVVQKTARNTSTTLPDFPKILQQQIIQTAQPIHSQQSHQQQRQNNASLVSTQTGIDSRGNIWKIIKPQTPPVPQQPQAQPPPLQHFHRNFFTAATNMPQQAKTQSTQSTGTTIQQYKFNDVTIEKRSINEQIATISNADAVSPPQPQQQHTQHYNQPQHQQQQPQQKQQSFSKPISPAAAATGGRKQAGNIIAIPNSITAKQEHQQKSNDEFTTANASAISDLHYTSVQQQAPTTPTATKTSYKKRQTLSLRKSQSQQQLKQNVTTEQQNIDNNSKICNINRRLSHPADYSSNTIQKSNTISPITGDDVTLAPQKQKQRSKRKSCPPPTVAEVEITTITLPSPSTQPVPPLHPLSLPPQQQQQNSKTNIELQQHFGAETEATNLTAMVDSNLEQQQLQHELHLHQQNEIINAAIQQQQDQQQLQMQVQTLQLPQLETQQTLELPQAEVEQEVDAEQQQRIQILFLMETLNWVQVETEPDDPSCLGDIRAMLFDTDTYVLCRYVDNRIKAFADQKYVKEKETGHLVPSPESLGEDDRNAILQLLEEQQTPIIPLVYLSEESLTEEIATPVPQILIQSDDGFRLLASMDYIISLLDNSGDSPEILIQVPESNNKVFPFNRNRLLEQITTAQSAVADGSRTTDLLEAAIVDSDLYSSETLEVDTSSQEEQLHLIGHHNVDDHGNSNIIFPAPSLGQAHLTPPITAHTSETSALLNQTPIMSTLEKPSVSAGNIVVGLNNSSVAAALLAASAGTLHTTNLTNASGLSICRPTLDDSLAVIGVTTQSSTVPSSLELPITVTNPAIAPKVTMATLPADIIQYHQNRFVTAAIANETRCLYSDPGS